MAVTQKTVVLNDFGGASLDRRERTSSSGTAVRYTVTIKAEPMVHVFNSKLLGSGPAMAIVEHLQKRVGAIGVNASPATQLKRKYAKNALARGEEWATERYDGGKLGRMEPNASPRLFNDSGRFIKSLVAAPTADNNWVINMAANRFDPSTFTGGEAGIVRLWNLLKQYVPEFGDANVLSTVPSIRQAIGESVDAIFVGSLTGEYGKTAALRERVRAGQLAAIQEALNLARTVGAL